MHESVPRKFGLIAGLGMGAGIFYYRSLVKAHLGRGLSPSILMVHADVRRVMGHAAAGQTRELATYLTGLLRQLASGGVQIGTIPANRSNNRLASSSRSATLSVLLELLPARRLHVRNSRPELPESSNETPAVNHHGFHFLK